jgi:ethanolamine utilization protein EutN
MQSALIIGRATATVKHPSMEGQKLLICQPLGADGQGDGDPLIVTDTQGCTSGDRVFISSDSKRLREIIGDNNTPLRWFILGRVDG